MSLQSKPPTLNLKMILLAISIAAVLGTFLGPIAGVATIAIWAIVVFIRPRKITQIDRIEPEYFSMPPLRKRLYFGMF